MVERSFAALSNTSFCSSVIVCSQSAILFSSCWSFSTCVSMYRMPDNSRRNCVFSVSMCSVVCVMVRSCDCLSAYSWRIAMVACHCSTSSVAALNSSFSIALFASSYSFCALASFCRQALSVCSHWSFCPSLFLRSIFALLSAFNVSIRCLSVSICSSVSTASESIFRLASSKADFFSLVMAAILAPTLE